MINASWTVPPNAPGDEQPILKEAIEEARDAGVLVVAAAGNDGVDIDHAPVFPAAYAYDNVLSVGGVKEDQSDLMDESNYGKRSVKVAISGEDILGTYISHSYALLTGTSASTALVSGIASLMIAMNPELTPEDITHILMEKSDPTDSLQEKTRSGGIVNPFASLKAAKKSVSSGEQGAATIANQTSTQETFGSAGASGGCSLIRGY